MRIVYLQDEVPPNSYGGAGISTFELAQGVRARGHDVTIITTCRTLAEAGESMHEGLTIMSIPSAYSAKWRGYVSLYNRPVVREVKKILQRIRPDIVHVNNVHFHLSYYSIVLACRYAHAVVFTARDTMAISYGKLDTPQYLEHFDARVTLVDQLRQAKRKWNPVRNLFIRWCLMRVTARYAVSSALKVALEQNGIIPTGVIHTGMNTKKWHTDSDNTARVRDIYGLHDKKVIFLGGRLSEGKGVGQVIKGLPGLLRYVPNTVLLVAGVRDGYVEQLLHEAEVLGVRDHIILVGWLHDKDLLAAYGVSDVVVVPSVYLDPFPRVVIEAMAVGKPVIGSRYGGAPEIIEDGVTGYVVDTRHPEAIIEKILDLLQNPVKARQFGNAGNERITRDFNMEAYVQRYISCYQKLVSERSK